MKKRGQITLKVLVELVVALALFSLFAYAGKVYGNGEIFQKAFVARDQAILIDSFYASSGNGYIIYPANVSELLIDYKGSKVTVSRFKGDPLAAEYSFAPRGDQAPDIELKNPEALIFGKTGDKIEVYTDKLPNLNKIKCIDLDTKGSYGKSLLIDADYRYTVPGVTISGLDESAITSAVAARLFAKAQGKFGDITYTRAGTIGENAIGLPQDKVDELADKADMIISIRSGDYRHKQNTLKVYYSDNPQSEKLACLILNRILDSKGMEFMGANIIPGSDPILKQGKLAVIVEAGNIQAENNAFRPLRPDENVQKELASRIKTATGFGVASYGSTAPNAPVIIYLPESHSKEEEERGWDIIASMIKAGIGDTIVLEGLVTDDLDDPIIKKPDISNYYFIEEHPQLKEAIESSNVDLSASQLQSTLDNLAAKKVDLREKGFVAWFTISKKVMQDIEAESPLEGAVYSSKGFEKEFGQLAETLAKKHGLEWLRYEDAVLMKDELTQYEDTVIGTDQTREADLKKILDNLVNGGKKTIILQYGRAHRYVFKGMLGGNYAFLEMDLPRMVKGLKMEESQVYDSVKEVSAVYIQMLEYAQNFYNEREIAKSPTLGEPSEQPVKEDDYIFNPAATDALGTAIYQGIEDYYG